MNTARAFKTLESISIELFIIGFLYRNKPWTGQPIKTAECNTEGDRLCPKQKTEDNDLIQLTCENALYASVYYIIFNEKRVKQKYISKTVAFKIREEKANLTAL